MLRFRLLSVEAAYYVSAPGACQPNLKCIVSSYALLQHVKGGTHNSLNVYVMQSDDIRGGRDLYRKEARYQHFRINVQWRRPLTFAAMANVAHICANAT